MKFIVINPVAIFIVSQLLSQECIVQLAESFRPSFDSSVGRAVDCSGKSDP